MSVTLYVSNDDGAIYMRDEIDDPDDALSFGRLQVPDVITLTPAQLCVGYNSIVEVLLRSGQGTIEEVR